MAKVFWIGAAQAVAQITTITFSAYTSGVTYYLTVNNKRVSYTAAASTSADVWAGLVAAWNASTYPEHVEAIATVGSGVVLTSRTAGTPFTVTASSSGVPTATVTATQAATGPNHFDNAANWLGGSAPSAGDDLVFANSSVSVLYNIDVSGTEYNDMTIDASYTGEIGLAAVNSSGASGYPEYRTQYLKLKSSTTGVLAIGAGNGSQSSLIRIDLNGADVSVIVNGTARAGASRPVDLINPASTAVCSVYAGAISLGASSTSTIGTLNVIKQSTQGTAPDVLVGSGVTVTAATISGGNVDNYGTLTLANSLDGATINNYGAIATLSAASSARVYWASSAGVGTKLNVYDGGTVDFSKNAAAKTVAAADLYKGGSLLDPLGVVTWTAGITLVGCRVADVALDVGRGQTLNV